MHTHFTYDQLTPLEQCIADFMMRNEGRKAIREITAKKSSPKEPVLNS